MDSQEQFQVPIGGMLAAVEEQRNAALSDAAQWKAVALQLKDDLGQANVELEKLRTNALS